MSVRSKRRPVPEGFELSRRTIGNAMVVHRVGTLTDEARTLALTVAEDTEHDLVVMDLPSGMPISMWESVATVLPRHRRGIRLVIGGRSRETTGLAGQWLSERLGRTVIAPDGVVTPGAGGSLFVHSGRGSGWVRFVPGHPPRWEAKRFPRPAWDCELTGETIPTSSRGLAEPVPGGVWIRPVGFEEEQRPNRSRLIGAMPVQPDVLTIVLGSPGHPPLSLDDVARLWVRLPAPLRQLARFVHYGPMSLPPGSTLGQALADFIGTEMTVYVGLPMGAGPNPRVFTVRPDGSPGWQVFAGELHYRPRAAGDMPMPLPSLVSHRAPLPELHELAPAVYWYAPDAVIEVVQSGLLVRSPEGGSHTGVVRAATVDSRVLNLTFDAVDEAGAVRMSQLAEDLALRLSEEAQRAVRVLPAAELVAERFGVQAGGVALAGIEAGELSAPRELFGAAQVDVSLADLPVADLTPSARPVLPAVAPPRLRLESAPSAAPGGGAARSVPAVTPSTGVPAAAVSAPVVPPERPVSPMPVPPIPVLPTRVSFASGRHVAAEPPPAQPPTAQPAEPPPSPAPQEPAPSPRPPAPQPQPAPPGPAVAARLQPTPAPEATALLPKRGIDDERAWLRKTLAAEYGTMSNAVARILSEHPGFQGALSRGSAEVLTDAVAVQLYLSPRGTAIDAGLRTGMVGPHVPLARCVVAGLSRLPSHRGPSVFACSPSPSQWALYRRQRFLTEWGFVNALTTQSQVMPGDTDVVVWSMSARRTRLLEPDAAAIADRVLFVPGTSFKILELIEPADGARGSILMRELTSTEVDASGRVDADRASLDELALNSMRQEMAGWVEKPSRVRMPAAQAARFGALPGLV